MTVRSTCGGRSRKRSSNDPRIARGVLDDVGDLVDEVALTGNVDGAADRRGELRRGGDDPLPALGAVEDDAGAGEEVAEAPCVAHLDDGLVGRAQDPGRRARHERGHRDGHMGCAEEHEQPPDRA